MSFFNQNFDEGFGERPLRGQPEPRNVPLRGPPLDQDVNSRRFDARTFPDPHRGMEYRPNNPPDYRGMDQRVPPPQRGLEPPHRPGDLRFDSHLRPSLLEPRGLDPRPNNELRSYDRPPPPHQASPRIDPRMNFGLPPTAMGGSALAPSMMQQPFRPSAEPSAPPPHFHQQPPNQSQLGLNSPFGPSLLGQFTRTSVTEVIPVHVDLATFASEPKFQQILLKVKEQAGVNFISLNRIADDLVESIVIDAPTKDAANLAKNLIETHLKLQMKIKAAENRLQRVQTDLFSTQGEIAAGQMVEFMIRPELIGLAIGKKGARIKQIETDTGVSSINVSDNGHIMIYGPDSQSVQRAREQLELHEEAFPLNNHQLEWMADKLNASVVVDLKNGSGVMVAKVNRETCKLDVVGTNPSVQTAKFLLATQLEYIDKQIEIEANEREAREKLNAVRRQYGLNNPQWKSRMGKTGRSRSPEETGRRGVEPSAIQYENNNTFNNVRSAGPGNVERPSGRIVSKGNDVVDSLVRAAMKDNVPQKSGKSLHEREQQVLGPARGDSGAASEGSEKVVLTAEDELDALISYPTESQGSKKQNDSRGNAPNAKRGAKELVMQETFLGASMKDVDAERSDLKGKGRDRGRDKAGQPQNRNANANNNNSSNNNIGPDNANNNNNKKGNAAKGGKTNNNMEPTNQQTNNSNNPANNKNKTQDKSQEKEKSSQQGQGKEDRSNNKGKEKTPALKAINQTAEAGGLLVIPPAPVLVVPPPPAGGTNNNQKNNKGKKGRKGDNKEETQESTKDESEDVVVAREEKKAKEPMLVKLNNPFLEQKGKKPETESSGSHRLVAIVNDDSSPRKQDTERRGRGRSDRSDSGEFTSALASLNNLDASDSSPTKQDAEEGKAGNNAKRREKKGKNKQGNNKSQEKDERSPSATRKESTSSIAPVSGRIEPSEVLKAISVSELEKLSLFDDHEPPLPRVVKKGPPAIPNKVVVVEPEKKKEVVSSESSSATPKEVKAAPAATAVVPISVDVTRGGEEAVGKKASSPPGLVPPPGLNKPSPVATASVAAAAPSVKPSEPSPVPPTSSHETSAKTTAPPPPPAPSAPVAAAAPVSYSAAVSSNSGNSSEDTKKE